MSLSIVEIGSASAGEWDAVWKECDYATYFHSREWSEIWSTYTEGSLQGLPLAVRFSDGKRVILPFSVQRILRGFSKLYLLSPAWTFGGWIALDGLGTDHTRLLTEYILQRTRNLVWRLNPYSSQVDIAMEKYGQPDETHAINLADGFDAIVRRWKKAGGSTLRKARRARREGVSIRLAVSREDWRAYYDVYSSSLDRWHNRNMPVYDVYGWRIFQDMFVRKSPYIKLWLAFCDNKVVAGALCFYAKRHSVYWHGAALEDYFPRRPVNLLMYETIKHACEQGYAWFDLNPSGGYEGVKAFKKTFGAIALPCPVIEIETRSTHLLRRIQQWMEPLQK